MLLSCYQIPARQVVWGYPTLVKQLKLMHTVPPCFNLLQCDIAMLTVDDDEFWEDVAPLKINGLPAMQESVMVVGFPTGGDNVCVTKGVVSRIDR